MTWITLRTSPGSGYPELERPFSHRNAEEPRRTNPTGFFTRGE
jgi:hypothetical protein